MNEDSERKHPTNRKPPNFGGPQPFCSEALRVGEGLVSDSPLPTGSLTGWARLDGKVL